MKKLTGRQAEIMAYIQEFIRLHKFPPTFREISEHFGITVRGSYDHIKALEKKGCLRCDKNRSRAIEVIMAESSPVLPVADAGNELTEIPRLGVVAAGMPIMAEENWDGTIPFPARQLKPGNYFAVEVKGQSMLHAGILDGDTAIIRQQNVATNGDIVVAMVDEAVTIKRYFKEQNRIRLKAENPEFPSIYSSEVRILGVLAHIVRNYPA